MNLLLIEECVISYNFATALNFPIVYIFKHFIGFFIPFIKDSFSHFIF